MFAGYAIESLGMRLVVMPHLLRPWKQSSLRGTAMMMMNSIGHETYPATRTAAQFEVVLSGRYGITTSLIPSLGPVNKQISPKRGFFTLS
jgi:hypothetical protein